MRTICQGLQELLAFLCCSAVLLAADGIGTIPFKLYRGYTIVVKGSIGDAERLTFVLDTGAVPTVVDRRIGRKLHLSGGTEGLSVFNGVVQGQRVVLPSIVIGPIQRRSLPALVEDLSFIEEGLGIRIDALVGLDVLGLSSISLNFESRKIVFGAADFAGSRARLEPGLPFAVVHLEVQGQPLRLLLDTGTKDTVLFERRLRKPLPGLRVVSEKVSSNMGGEVRLRKVKLASVRLGDADLGNLSADMMPSPNGPGVGFDGLMAVASLGAKEVQIDFEHFIVSWR